MARRGEMRHLLPLLALAAIPALSAPARSAAVCDGAIADPSRDRSIPVRVRMPEGAAAKAPVILFSHGLGGSVDAGTDYAKDWAAAGFLVIHVQHPGSDSAVWKGSADPRRELATAATGGQLADRVKDMRQVADAVAAGRNVGGCDLGRGDPARMGAAGHSFGAHTVLALAGQSYGPMGAVFRDPRFKAVAALSPNSPRGDAAGAAAAFGELAIPVLTATGSADGNPLDPNASVADAAAARAAVFAALPASRTGKSSVGLWVEGADHSAFSGNTRPGKAPNRHATALVSAATLGFFRANLGGNGVPDLAPARALLTDGDKLQVK